MDGQVRHNGDNLEGPICSPSFKKQSCCDQTLTQHRGALFWAPFLFPGPAPELLPVLSPAIRALRPYPVYSTQPFTAFHFYSRCADEETGPERLACLLRGTQLVSGSTLLSQAFAFPQLLAASEAVPPSPSAPGAGENSQSSSCGPGDEREGGRRADRPPRCTEQQVCTLAARTLCEEWWFIQTGDNREVSRDCSFIKNSVLRE